MTPSLGLAGVVIAMYVTRIRNFSCVQSIMKGEWSSTVGFHILHSIQTQRSVGKYFSHRSAKWLKQIIVIASTYKARLWVSVSQILTHVILSRTICNWYYCDHCTKEGAGKQSSSVTCWGDGAGEGRSMGGEYGCRHCALGHHRNGFSRRCWPLGNWKMWKQDCFGSTTSSATSVTDFIVKMIRSQKPTS